jgi:hypothetical protein
MKVQIVNPFRISHLQRYGVTVRVTSVYPPLLGPTTQPDILSEVVLLKSYSWSKHTYTHSYLQIYTYEVMCNINPLTPELNSSAQRYLTKIFTGDFAY